MTWVAPQSFFEEPTGPSRTLIANGNCEVCFGIAASATSLERVWEICSSCFRCVIQALDVDRAESWPDGEDCQEDEALPI